MSWKEIDEFNKLLESIKVFDLPTARCRYTWFREMEYPKSRIDRIQVSQDGIYKWPK